MRQSEPRNPDQNFLEMLRIRNKWLWIFNFGNLLCASNVSVPGSSFALFFEKMENSLPAWSYGRAKRDPGPQQPASAPPLAQYPRGLNPRVRPAASGSGQSCSPLPRIAAPSCAAAGTSSPWGRAWRAPSPAPSWTARRTECPGPPSTLGWSRNCCY